MTEQVFRVYRERRARADEPGGYCPACGSVCRLQLTSGRLRATCQWCGRVRYRNPLPGVALVIEQEGRVLLARRRPEGPLGGRWGLPAGFVEYDEDFLTAAHREGWEETGLQLELTGVANVSSNFLSEDLHCLVVVVCARPIGGRLRPGDDVDELCWARTGGPYPELAFEGDAFALERLDRGELQTLPVDARYARRALPAPSELGRSR